MLKFYDILDPEELQTIHQASLEVLSRTGMEVEHPLILERLADAGVEVDFKNNRIRFPARLVEDAMVKAPGEFL